MDNEQPYIVIFDIDGTLADNEHRIHHLHKEPKDWMAFFAAQAADSVREDVLEVLKMYNEKPDTQVFLLTGRGEEWRDTTEQWLHWYDIPHDHLVMRPFDNRVNDDILKIEQIREWQEEGYTIVGLYDDRKRICDAAREHGITVFQMAAGEF